MADFSTTLRFLRRERQLSQADLATQLELSRSTISMYEQGEREPDFETLEKIADYFNVDMDYLLGRKVSRRGPEYEPTYDDMQHLLARNGNALTVEEKMRLIKLLSEL